MKTDVWLPLYIGDYLADTSRLTTEQHGAYLLLIMDYWRNGPPPDDDSVLAQITRMSPDAWSNACSTIRAFFKHVDGKLIHGRIEAELEEAGRKKATAVAKAAKAAEVRWHKHAPSTTQAMLEQCPSPSPSPSPIENLEPLSDKSDEVVLKNGKAKFKGDAEIVLAFLNDKAGKRFRPVRANLDLIASRLKEGATVADCRSVIAIKCRQWNGTDQAMYLRPETLFNATKFAQYVGELGSNE